jgi:hypothetical protein
MRSPGASSLSSPARRPGSAAAAPPLPRPSTAAADRRGASSSSSMGEGGAQTGAGRGGGPPSSSSAATPSACLGPSPSLSGDSYLPVAPPWWLRHGGGGEATAAATGARTAPLRSSASARSSSPLLRAAGWGRVPSLGARPSGRWQTTVVGPVEDGGGSRIPLDLEDLGGIPLFPVSLQDTAAAQVPSSLSSGRLSRVPVRMVQTRGQLWKESYRPRRAQARHVRRQTASGCADKAERLAPHDPCMAPGMSSALLPPPAWLGS